LGGYPATHVSQLCWQDFDDRPLLEYADARFDVLITADQSIPAQQNLSRYQLALIILKAQKNTVLYLLPLVPDLFATLDIIRPGDRYELKA
jgi:hypothetical protein